MYRTLNSYDVERGAFMTWITTMTRNLLVDHFRKTSRIGHRFNRCGAIEHQDAMPLSDRIEDKGSRPMPGCRAGSAGSRPRGPAEAFP